MNTNPTRDRVSRVGFVLCDFKSVSERTLDHFESLANEFGLPLSLGYH